MKKLLQIGLLAACLTASDNVVAQTEATYYTNMGEFKVMLTDTLTPITVDSFISRVAAKFYDGLIFHRVINNFMIQGGDPLGTGFGGPGYTTPDEFDPSLSNISGALAMANSGPNTNGSQFYINLVNNTYLDNDYTVFGMVTTNFPVVQAIGNVTTNSSDKPLTDVVIDSIRITNIPASVSNINNGITASIYPNPSRGVFTIELPSIVTEIEIIDMRGCMVYHTTAKGRLDVDLRTYPTGLYIVRATNGNGTWERKLIIQ